MLLALCVLIVALARPRAGNEKFLIRSQGIDIVLAIDLSGSMASYDVPRNITSGRDLVNAIEGGQLKNRLEVAKEEIAKFIAERPNDRIGLIGFADVAYNLAPPTLDHSWLLAHLANLKPGILGEMTGIASPIGTGVSRLKDSDAPRRVLVLFTDGAIRPATVLRRSRRRNSPKNSTSSFTLSESAAAMRLRLIAGRFFRLKTSLTRSFCVLWLKLRRANTSVPPMLTG